ncbi:MAG: bifunctional chorismate mutase/prephenate dehydratase [Lachnospiraceae bacterium]|nr:bifunctional chorismate mutase/prephenate dehydratase [Lachnospiraceae bacterium]
MNREKKIAYSGIPGAYAHIASEKIFPEAEYVSFPSFGSVYEAVTKGECDHGVLPIENSFAGDVAQVMDLLYFGTLYIAGIYEMPIVHHLLGIPGTELAKIDKVLSHPQALDQCREYIHKGGFVQHAATNTAVAAKEVSDRKDPTLAAIASRETAEIYGLKILDKKINEKDDNMTRFVVISREKEALINKREAFSLILTVKNEAGAFAKAITTIGELGFNMRAIRSRPAKSLAWSYYFYIEGEGDLDGENGPRMLKELKDNCEVIRVLGNYPADIILS